MPNIIHEYRAKLFEFFNMMGWGLKFLLPQQVQQYPNTDEFWAIQQTRHI